MKRKSKGHGRTSCMYCGRSQTKKGKPFVNQRACEEHERTCLLNPNRKSQEPYSPEASDMKDYSPTEIELTDSVSIYR